MSNFNHVLFLNQSSFW